MSRRISASEAGLSLPELLVASALLALLAGLGFGSGQRWLAGQRLEATTRRVLVGLERGREQAQRQGRPCALALAATGWRAPNGGELPGCLEQELPLREVVGAGVTLQHNLPPALRFSANGLLLDGGTVRLAAAGGAERCVVVALPLGITRVGRWREGSCVPA